MCRAAVQQIQRTQLLREVASTTSRESIAVWQQAAHASENKREGSQGVQTSHPCPLHCSQSSARKHKLNAEVGFVSPCNMAPCSWLVVSKAYASDTQVSLSAVSHQQQQAWHLAQKGTTRSTLSTSQGSTSQGRLPLEATHVHAQYNHTTVESTASRLAAHRSVLDGVQPRAVLVQPSSDQGTTLKPCVQVPQLAHEATCRGHHTTQAANTNSCVSSATACKAPRVNK